MLVKFVALIINKRDIISVRDKYRNFAPTHVTDNKYIMLPTWQKRNAKDKSRTRRNECGKQKLHVENTFDVHLTN